MKKIICTIIISIFLWGCSNSNKEEIISFYVNSDEDTFTYGDLTVDVLQIDGDCVKEFNCSTDDDIKVFVSAGINEQKKDYVISTDSDYVKVNGTKNYINLNINDGQIVIAVYE